MSIKICFIFLKIFLITHFDFTAFKFLKNFFRLCTAPLEHSPSPSPHLACAFKDADELRYAWLTFPSLHAAFSSYSACFASVSFLFKNNVF